MSQTIETNLADFLNKLDQKIDKLREEISDVKISLAKLEEGQNSLKQQLEETKNGLGMRI
jgi:prefoldin subunit 5